MSEKNPSDNCRFCNVSFKLKFGSHSSSENLFKPSKRKDCFGVVLADICSQVGLKLLQNSLVSDRVCNPCGRKIRNLGQLFQLVKAAIQSASTPVKSQKRALDTPDKASPSWRKSKTVRVHSPAAKTKSSRKSLAFAGQNTCSEKEDEMLRRLNVDDLPQDGLQVKIVYLNPSGNVTVRIPRDEQTRTLVKNIVCEKWREVSKRPKTRRNSAGIDQGNL